MLRFRRLLRSFQYAFRGLCKTWREEQNLQIQSAAGLLAVGLAAYFGITRPEWVMLIMAIGLVLLAETVNSAIERITDVLKPRINGYVKEIKDIMAAAVMLASLTALLAGIIIFAPYIFK